MPPYFVKRERKQATTHVKEEVIRFKRDTDKDRGLVKDGKDPEDQLNNTYYKTSYNNKLLEDDGNGFSTVLKSKTSMPLTPPLVLEIDVSPMIPFFSDTVSKNIRYKQKENSLSSIVFLTIRVS